MIYTYLFTDEFFNDWRTTINSNQAYNIDNFLNNNFINKENIFYCGSEEILYKNTGLNGANSSLIDYFINGFVPNGGVSIFSNKENTVDFIFCGKNEKIENDIFQITCEQIIKDKNLKKIIRMKTEDIWSNRKGKNDLIKKLDKLLKISKTVYFIDRHIPGIVADQNKMQLSQWNKSLKFFKNLISKRKNKSFFVNAVKNEIFERYRKKLVKIESEFLYIEKDILDNKTHEMLKNDLHNFYKVLEDIKTIILVKNKEAYYSGLHDRFIFFFLDDNRVLKKALEDDTLIIIEVTQGLNILDGKGKTTLPRRITRQNRENCNAIVEEWEENVENKPLFYKFTAGLNTEEKKAS